MKWTVLFVCLFVSGFTFAQDDNFATGNTAYANGDYEAALKAYNKLVADEQLSASLFYNLGNTYYKLDELGEAIWAYEKALKINPGNADVQFNLDFANESTFDEIEGDESVIGKWLAINLFSFSINFWSWLSILFSVLLSVALILFFLGKKQRIKNTGITLGFVSIILLIASVVLATTHKQQILAQSEGVVVESVVEIKTSPSDTAPKGFELHEGTKVDLLRTNKNWIEITINGNTGWVNKELIWSI